MRFYGKVGYGETVELDPTRGIYGQKIIERNYTGDVIRDTRDLRETDKVNDDISVGNSISVVADAYANEHYFDMKYVVWNGSRWKVTEVEVQRPRLLLRLGGIWNGSTPETSQ